MKRQFPGSIPVDIGAAHLHYKWLAPLSLSSGFVSDNCAVFCQLQQLWLILNLPEHKRRLPFSSRDHRFFVEYPKDSSNQGIIGQIASD